MPAPVAGRRPCRPQVRSSILGLTAAELVGHFGNPALQVREGVGLKLQFRSPRCVLDAYLYPPASGSGVAARDLCRYAAAVRRRDRSGGLYRRARRSELSERPFRGFGDRPGRGRRDAARMAGASAGSPLLPAAIRQLRIIRLTADPLDRRAGEHLAEGGIVEREQVVRGAARRARRGAGTRGWRRRHRRSGSTGRPRGNRRSRRCGCRSPREIRAGSVRHARSSGRKCSAAHRSGAGRRTPASGRRRGSGCRCRNAAP